MVKRALAENDVMVLIDYTSVVKFERCYQRYHREHIFKSDSEVNYYKLSLVNWWNGKLETKMHAAPCVEYGGTIFGRIVTKNRHVIRSIRSHHFSIFYHINADPLSICLYMYQVRSNFLFLLTHSICIWLYL